MPSQAGRRPAEGGAAGTSRPGRDEGATACAIGGSSGRAGSSENESPGEAGVGGSRARSNTSSLTPTRSAWGGWGGSSTRRPRRVDAHTHTPSARWLLRVCAYVPWWVGPSLPPPRQRRSFESVPAGERVLRGTQTAGSAEHARVGYKNGSAKGRCSARGEECKPGSV